MCCEEAAGGILYYAIPDERNSFDIDRPLTEFDHLVADDADGGVASRLEHFRSGRPLSTS